MFATTLIRLVATPAIGLALAASAVALPAPHQPEIRDVEILVYLIDVNRIDSVSESFEANVSYQLSWRDPSLAHDGNDSISKVLDDVWHPPIQLLNQRRVTSTFPESVAIRPDGTVLYRQRLAITLVDVGFGTTRINSSIPPRIGHARHSTDSWLEHDWLGNRFGPTTPGCRGGLCRRYRSFG